MKLLIIGSSLAGKTTIIRKLREMGVKRVSEIDEELIHLNHGIFPENVDKLHKVLAPQIIKDVLKKRGNFAFFCNTDYFSMNKLRLAKTKGYMIISLRVPLAELIRRNEERDDVAYYPVVNSYLKEMVNYQKEMKRYDLADLEINGKRPVKSIAESIYKLMNAKIPPKPTLYFFIGLPFAGKTTFSRMLSDRLNIPRISFDERWLGVTAEFGHVPGRSSHAKWLHIKRSCENDIARFLKNGVSVIYDNLLDVVEHRDYMRKIARRNHAKSVCFYVDYSKEEVIARRQRNLITKRRHQVADDIFYHALEQFHKPLAREKVVPIKTKEDLRGWLEGKK